MEQAILGSSIRPTELKIGAKEKQIV